jgi:hypothetical protein
MGMFKSSLLLAALLAASFSEAHLIQGIIDSKEENMQFIIVY